MEIENVVGYCRASTNGQVGEDKFGIDAQKAEIMKYCAAHNMRVSDWYVDEGVSGTVEERPELDRLLFGEVKNPPVKAVIVYKSDRVARDIKLYFYYMMLLEKKGISLISATEPIVDDDSGLGGVYRALMLFVAEQERKNIMKRTAGGRSLKAARGGYSGGRAPIGYKVENHKLVISDDERPVVEYIFERRARGATLKQIADGLNEQGLTTRSDGPFYTSNVQSILANEKTYRGYYRYGKNGEWVLGEHEAILD